MAGQPCGTLPGDRGERRDASAVTPVNFEANVQGNLASLSPPVSSCLSANVPSSLPLAFFDSNSSLSVKQKKKESR